jgi:hypothetical protein
VPDGCGGTLSCGTCSGTTICVTGTCQPCDVCESGCSFSAIGPAIASANDADTIRICPGLYTGNITLDKNLTLIGAGDGNSTSDTLVQGAGGGAVVTIGSGHRVSLQDLRITGGSARTHAGGIDNFGALTLTGCTIFANTGSAGGGIFNDAGGTLTLNDCAVTGNTASDGGGILTAGALTLTNSTVSVNTARDLGGGIANSQARVTLDGASRVVGNQTGSQSPASGGGIFNLGGTVTLSSANTVSGNIPSNCGGDAVPLCAG